ncbi:MAG: ABC transporter permease subunit/CPBP intramembrane protease [Verrucomicrobiota bacterium]
MRLSIIWIIFCKEITEALRDRITLLVLVGLPLLIYPLSIMTMMGVTKHQAAVEERQVNTIAVWGVGGTALLDWLAPSTNRFKVERWQAIPASLRSELEAGRLPPPPPRTNVPAAPNLRRPGLPRLPTVPEAAPDDAVLQAARGVVSGKQADAVLVIWPGFDDAQQRHDLGRVAVYYDSILPRSAQAWSRLSGQLGQFRQQLLKERQRERGLPDGFAKALDVRGDDVAPAQRQIRNVLGQVLPPMLILLALVGAIVAATELTAGEKDRATMQTLLCAPVRSFEIVVGKFMTIWGISLISALANIIGLGLTIWRLAAMLHVDVIQFRTLAMIGGLLLPASWTIAALFLAVAALARDAKDAGNFLGATAIVVMLPVGATLMPGAELDAWTCCVPLVNLSLLIRTLMNGPVASHLLFLTLLSSLAYAGLALALAARVFGREQILLGGSFSWRGLLQSDRQRPAVPTPGLVLTWFPLAVVGLFYASLALAEHNVSTILLVTQYGVLLLPVLVLAGVRKYPLAQTFSLHRPHGRSIVGSVLIGLTVSVALAGLVLRVAPPPDSVLSEMQEVMQLGDRPAALWKLWLVLALTPALCEETFFRGLMLSGLRRWGPWAAIGLTALLFGLLHGSIYRLLPTFILGLVLGYVVWRSGSLYCSLLIHALNNGLIATLVWSSKGQALDIPSVPWSLTLGALVVTGIGVALITGPKPPPPA